MHETPHMNHQTKESTQISLSHSEATPKNPVLNAYDKRKDDHPKNLTEPNPRKGNHHKNPPAHKAPGV